MITQRFLRAGVLIAAWQYFGCSKISEQFEPTANTIGTIAFQTNHRKVFQHSVIPGGVYSGTELARARRTDPVVALHYADFGEEARPSRLTTDELVYVSYRKADKVFWTQKKHRVCQGEAIIKDAKGNVARSRCGNRLSKTPKLPTAKGEPTEAALNSPDLGPLGPVQTGAGPLEAMNLPIPPFDPGGAAGGAAGNTPNPNDRKGAGETSAPTKTGASAALPPPDGFSPFLNPYFSAGPLAAPALAAATATTGGSTTPTTTTTPTTGGTVTTTLTPEPQSILLVLAGGLSLCLISAKGAAALRQGGKELASPFGGALDTAPVLRAFLKTKGRGCAPPGRKGTR